MVLCHCTFHLPHSFGVSSASLGTSSEQDRWTFTLTETKRVYFDSLTVNVNGNDSYYLRWYLSGPDGTLVSDRPLRQRQ